MARPRIFVSSTYYDLKHIRNNLETFIEDMGYEAILYESGDIPFQHDLSLDKSCYKAIEDAHMQILIIGGRYGSADSEEKVTKGKKNSTEKMYDFYNSITKQEFHTALEKGLPIYFFFENNVLSEYSTYKNNRNNETIKYAHVDSINIFKLLDEIYSLNSGNYIKGFEKFEDIENWLIDQWAGLFSTFLENQKNKIELKNLSSKINELGSITTALKEYTEAIMRKIQPDNYQRIIEKEDYRIKEEKALRFSEEGMIRHLSERFNIAINPIKIYENFVDSNDLEDFLKRCNMNSVEISEFLSVHNEVASREYQEFFRRYLGKN